MQREMGRMQGRAVEAGGSFAVSLQQKGLQHESMRSSESLLGA